MNDRTFSLKYWTRTARRVIVKGNLDHLSLLYDVPRRESYEIIPSPKSVSWCLLVVRPHVAASRKRNQDDSSGEEASTYEGRFRRDTVVFVSAAGRAPGTISASGMSPRAKVTALVSMCRAKNAPSPRAHMASQRSCRKSRCNRRSSWNGGLLPRILANRHD